MKGKFAIFIGTLLCVVGTCMGFFTSCQKESETFIDPSSVEVRLIRGEGEDILAAAIILENAEIQGDATLADVMEILKDERTFTYTFSQGMLTEINGKKSGGSSCWMLYTDDSSMSNTAWGTYEYEGETLGSAIFGAETLQVRKDGVYVWAYQSL